MQQGDVGTPSRLQHHWGTNATYGETQCNMIVAQPRELAGTLGYCNITRDLMQRTKKPNAT
jgi:hypothetical protein